MPSTTVMVISDYEQGYAQVADIDDKLLSDTLDASTDYRYEENYKGLIDNGQTNGASGSYDNSKNSDKNVNGDMA